MHQKEILIKMQYHSKQYNYYKGLIMNWFYTTTIDTRENEIEVIERVAKKYWIHIDEIRGSCRYKPLSQARSDIVKILKDDFHLTYKRIASVIWFKEHSACIYLYNKKYDNCKNSKEVS